MRLQDDIATWQIQVPWADVQKNAQVLSCYVAFNKDICIFGRQISICIIDLAEAW